MVAGRPQLSRAASPERLPSGSQLLRRGAEAVLYRRKWHDLDVVVKQRVAKRYRVPSLDLKIRQFRTIHESNLLHEAKQTGVMTPLIYSIDLKSASIIMEFVSGDRLKDVLNGLEPSRLDEVVEGLGVLIGRLHKAGIVHGDLTTSNMILTSGGEICLLDFGLGEHSTELEARGVDLHILKTVFFSTHHSIAERCFGSAVNGYKKEMEREEVDTVLRRTDQIGKRGRYVSVR